MRSSGTTTETVAAGAAVGGLRLSDQQPAPTTSYPQSVSLMWCAHFAIYSDKKSLCNMEFTEKRHFVCNNKKWCMYKLVFICMRACITMYNIYIYVMLVRMLFMKMCTCAHCNKCKRSCTHKCEVINATARAQREKLYI